jgi:hypothetical protein
MIKDLTDIELFTFKDEKMNNKKKDIKKIVIALISFVVYTISLVTGSIEMVKYKFGFAPNNICNCSNNI